MNIVDIFESINDGMRNGLFEHHDVIEQFKEFIDESLILKVELGFSDSDIEKLTNASVALGQAYDVRINEATSIGFLT